MAPIRDWTGAITLSPTAHKIRRSVKSAQWKINGDRLCIVAESSKESKTKT